MCELHSALNMSAQLNLIAADLCCSTNLSCDRGSVRCSLWKIQRDMAERGWTLDQVKATIEQRKPDCAVYVAPQMEFSDVVISVLPSEISKEPVGTHLRGILFTKLAR